MANIDFSFKSSIKDIQNRLITQSIRSTSNLELLRSEEAIQDVIKSYMDRFQAVGGMLFDVSKYLAESKEVIRSEDFNEMFGDIYVDLSALYGDLSLMEQILELNLQRNKNYFAIVKKRIRDLWNKLNLARLYIFDSNPADESYYESFFTGINADRVQNVYVDKKNGYLHLRPRSKEIHNRSHLIKKVTSVTYPVNSDNGGAYHTTNELNTFDDNYKNGPRDMLQNGLWKDEVICSEVPNLIYNIGTDSLPLRRNYRGILSIIDIEYAYPVEINRLDLDVFGDKPLLIDAILYKKTEDSDWQVANFALEDPLIESNPNSITKRHSARGQAFDIIAFYNISKITAKYLRLVINQENYEFIETRDTGESELDLKIQNDLSERRYELVKFGANYEKALTTPVNDENVSLYNKVIDVVESVSNIESILSEIEKILIPAVDIVTYDFTRTIKFETGAWSIEPIHETYERQNGIFDSNPYPLRDRALVSVSLKTKQQVPESTTCNWYINVANQDIPIAENSTVMRKEPVSALSMSQYQNFSNWSPGAFVLLDLPVDPLIMYQMGIYTNGEFSELTEPQIAALNSRLLYIKDLEDPYRSEFVLRYPCAMYSSVNVYVLSIKPTTSAAGEIIPLGLISSRREILKAFIDSVRYKNTADGPTEGLLNEKYSISNAHATFSEAKTWFGAQFNHAIFMAEEITPYLDASDVSNFSSVLRQGPSKLSSTKADMLTYFSGAASGPADLNVISSIANVAPFRIVRSL